MGAEGRESQLSVQEGAVGGLRGQPAQSLHFTDEDTRALGARELLKVTQ